MYTNDNWNDATRNCDWNCSHLIDPFQHLVSRSVARGELCTHEWIQGIWRLSPPPNGSRGEDSRPSIFSFVYSVDGLLPMKSVFFLLFWNIFLFNAFLQTEYRESNDNFHTFKPSMKHIIYRSYVLRLVAVYIKLPFLDYFVHGISIKFPLNVFLFAKWCGNTWGLAYI